MNRQSTIWRIPDLFRSAEMKLEKSGNPQVVTKEGRECLAFDGQRDALVVGENPLAGASEFTLEALFSAEAGGQEEQRFVHIQGDDESRALLELRSEKDGWYADVFVHFQDGERFLNDPVLIHPFGCWTTLALSFDGLQLRQHVNGRLELQDTLRPGKLGAGRVSLGMRINGVSPFRGRLACVRFTPAALDEDELMRPG